MSYSHRIAPFFYISCLFLSAQLTLAQSNQLKGSILDVDSREPISMCNVYLSGTSIGVASDENGNFLLENISPGEYTLVISHINYRSLVRQINLLNGSLDLKKITLRENEETQMEVVVESSVDKKWRRQFRRLSKFLMGDGYNAKNIAFLNEYVVEFEEEKGRMLRHIKDFSLQVENHHLGYFTNYLVKDFSMGGKTQYVVGYPSFREMETDNEGLKRKWKRNRAKSYEGSMRHFFKSLLNNELEENGFVVNVTNFDPERSIDHYTRVFDNSKYNRPLNLDELSSDFKIEPTDHGNIHRIIFKDIIEVYYVNTTDGESIHSLIKPIHGEFLVYDNGVPLNAGALKLFGFFSEQGLYNMLPLGYD